MNDPVFQRHARTLTLGEIAVLTGSQVRPAALAARRISDVATLGGASPQAIAFFDNETDRKEAAATRAGACLTTARLAKLLPERVPVLVVADPLHAFVEVARALFPGALRASSLAQPGGMAGAQVHPSARLESGVTVEPGAVIGPQAEIGSGTIIGANAVIGGEVRIGRGCSIGAGSIVTDALIGDRVVVHPGCKIGQEGFGFILKQDGRKLPHVGRVIIQDGVEIGAGTTIDRGAMGDTVIGEASKIDNLVQVGQNACIGRRCIVMAQAGIPGSAILEDFAVLGARENRDMGSGR